MRRRICRRARPLILYSCAAAGGAAGPGKTKGPPHGRPFAQFISAPLFSCGGASQAEAQKR